MLRQNKYLQKVLISLEKKVITSRSQRPRILRLSISNKSFHALQASNNTIFS